MMRIAIFTGSRADYGLLRPLIRALRGDDRFEVGLIVSGSHLDSAHGMTIDEIIAEEGPVVARVPLPLSDDSPLGVARASAAALEGVAGALESWRPDVLVILGDRYEALAAATAATILRVPIAHIHGGELSFGAIDDAFRHAITKMSALHFTATDDYRRRVVQMGADPDTVYNVGALAADNALAVPALSPSDFAERFGVTCDGGTLLVTFHPVSSGDRSVSELEQLLAALGRLTEFRVLFTGSNADAEGRILNQRILEWVDQNSGRAEYIVSLGHDGYMAAVKNAAGVIGNSSSGLIEAPIIGTPSINVGERQAARFSPEGVVHVPAEIDAIVEGVRAVVASRGGEPAGRVRPFGDGHTADRIVQVLTETAASLRGRMPTFFDIDSSAF